MKRMKTIKALKLPKLTRGARDLVLAEFARRTLEAEAKAASSKAERDALEQKLFDVETRAANRAESHAQLFARVFLDAGARPEEIADNLKRFFLEHRTSEDLLALVEHAKNVVWVLYAKDKKYEIGPWTPPAVSLAGPGPAETRS